MKMNIYSLRVITHTHTILATTTILFILNDSDNNNVITVIKHPDRYMRISPSNDNVCVPLTGRSMMSPSFAISFIKD